MVYLPYAGYGPGIAGDPQLHRYKSYLISPSSEKRQCAAVQGKAQAARSR